MRTELDTSPQTLSAAALLQGARSAVEQSYPCDDSLARAALHLIECATDVVVRLPERDLASARDVLGAARAAVVTATVAVREIHDRERGEQVAAPAGPGRVVCGLDR
ncbi:hypothetical protein QFZ55_004785 [Streptomyces luteogriseus]|jgi:hypothetical protein|uniref:hypothetical protein n=1 Tax=Streptomyces luteogriseus TaxID=68233 RepID=UPI0011674303|nr:hypothetical protein [Streptomyces luteogriseus]MDQ0715333.1 hypothetical protein [Streptomyces luteogriseus]